MKKNMIYRTASAQVPVQKLLLDVGTALRNTSTGSNMVSEISPILGAAGVQP
jgi:hypothetical protein